MRHQLLSPPWGHGPAPGPAYLPPLASGVRLSSVTTCGRRGRRCLSPSASVMVLKRRSAPRADHLQPRARK